MYQADTRPRPSIFYDYQIYPYRRPPELNGAQSLHPVVVVGAGPVGLATALDLARQGIACVLLSAEQQVSEGSRALAYTRRSMEILQQVGVAHRISEQGLPWRFGNSYYRGQRVYRLDVPFDEDDRFAPLTNLQQQYLEQFLIEALLQQPLVDLRMGHKLLGLSQDSDRASLTVDTPDGPYEMQAQWVVACDGARSTVRQQLQLRMEGTSYEGRFVIADIRCELGLPTERLAFFDPPWNPGNTVLMHREPHGLWRVDYQLPAGETAEQALDPSSMAARINWQLDMIGKGGTPWEMDWSSVYSARTLTLSDYVHGRVLFAGDAAHMLPIFGVRGANTGWQDGHNLAWKLAMILKGKAGPRLLPTYSHERVKAAREIIDEASRSVRFMTPPTAGFRLMRDAVLSLALTEASVRPLLNWRTSRPHEYVDSPLNTPDDDDRLFQGGWPNGATLRNVRLGTDDYLFDHLPASFHLIVFDPQDHIDPALQEAVRRLQSEGVPIRLMLMRQSHPEPQAAQADLELEDLGGKARERFGIQRGSGFYLVRPDHHVCSRWMSLSATALTRAVRTALGH